MADNLLYGWHQGLAKVPLHGKTSSLCKKNDCTVSKRVLILRTWSLIRTFLAFWVLIYISGSLLSLFWLHSRKECQFSLHVYNNGSGLNCWQILIFTYVYALIFIHRRFGSLFWLLRVLIGSLFHKKWVLIGSLSPSFGVLFSFGASVFGMDLGNFEAAGSFVY